MGTVTLFEKFNLVRPNFISIGLRYENSDDFFRYFCTPMGAIPFASMGLDGIHYCFIDGFQETIFVVNPESTSDNYVFPISNNFDDFLRLVVSLHGTQLLDLVMVYEKEEFSYLLENHKKNESSESIKELNKLKEIFDIIPMDNPYEYIKNIMSSVDVKNIMYTDQYYDVLGIEK